MLPEALLRYSVREGTAVPHYLTECDHPWLRALLDEVERFAGRPERELLGRLREPLPCASPPAKRALAAHVLRGLLRRRTESPVRPRAARAAAFVEAACEGERNAALARAGRRLGAAPAAIEEALFADLPGERRLVPPERPLAPGELALRANLALAQGFLFRSTRVRLEAVGNARAVVRQAKLGGLICTVLPRGGRGEEALLEVSGPLSVFRRTLVYGRALAWLLPPLAWCARFRLESECVLRGRALAIVLGSGDPLFPPAEPRRYDSRLEEGLARDFRRLAPDWDVIREPEPVEAGGKLVFPDFALRHRRDPARRWLLEVAGFWTADYVARKLADLRAARLGNLILCIDADRNVGEGDLPPATPVVRFRRRIDPAAVLRAISAR